MKKIIFSSLLCLLILSCKSSSSAAGTNLDKKAEVAIKGTWEIASVSYPGSDVISVNSFDIADSKCFIGSNWKFVSNNNTGTMAIQKRDCPSFSSPITWYINKEGNFVMKVLNAGEKAKRVREGYVLRVANQTDGSFQLVDRITVGGSSADVVYQFIRVN